MARADDIRALAEAEANVAELEDELVAAKEAGEDTEALKLNLREARQAFREQRQGSVIVSPETITATAQVQDQP